MATNLPRYATPFFGRAQEVRELVALLADCRLLTLVGPGGMGKTRLALEIASQMSFPHGAHFIPLTPTSAASDIPQVIARVFGLHLEAAGSPQDQLLDFLKGRNLLLVLDNFEHLLDGGAQLVMAILDAAPEVKILVTSRQALSLQAEWIRLVSGLDLPAAVELFAERARRVRGDFPLAEQRAGVVRICQLAEGMPLAVELAAAWTRTLSCDQIAAEIAHNLGFLASPLRDLPERHRSMRAVFDHSWLLLAANEQRVFARLAVFRGGFTREAAEVIAGASVHVLAALVGQSLVDARGRYSLHELLRQYAEAHLGDEAEALHEAHSVYYLRFVASLAPGLKGGRQVEAAREFAAELDNVRAAWDWAVARKHHTLIDAALETLRVYYDEGFTTDQTVGLEMLRSASAAFNPQQAVYWRLRASTAAILFRDEGSRAELERCLEAARHDRAETAFCLFALAYTIAFGDNDALLALQHWKESCARYRQLGDSYWVARNLAQIAFWSHMAGRYGDVGPALRESLKISQQIGDKAGMAITLSMLASEPERRGDNDENERILRESMALYTEIESRGWAAMIKSLLCLTVLIPRGDLEAARRLGEEALQESLDTHFLVHGVKLSLCVLSIIASLDGGYENSSRFLERSMPLSYRNPVDHEFLEWADAILACGVGNYARAARALSALLRRAEAPERTLNIAMRTLPIAAILFAQAGRPEDSAEILSLAHIYSDDLIGWASRWHVTATLRRDLEAKLGTQAFDAAWKRGRARDAAQTIRDVLGGLSAGAGRLQLPSGSRVDELTSREREVLALVAGGLSDREIADQLVISLATVKWHNRQIFDKLQVHSRTQAIARGRELRLIE